MPTGNDTRERGGAIRRTEAVHVDGVTDTPQSLVTGVCESAPEKLRREPRALRDNVDEDRMGSHVEPPLVTRLVLWADSQLIQHTVELQH